MAEAEQGIITAEAAVRDAEDQLKRLTNLAADPQAWNLQIVPVDTPIVQTSMLPLDSLVAIAMQNRPDVYQAKKGLEAQKLSLRVSRNSLLPSLNASGNYSLSDTHEELAKSVDDLFAGGRNAWLIEIVARDKTIETLKGKSPVIPENQRRAVIESLKPVDEAFLGYENMSLIDTIQKLKPAIIAVGYDQERIKQEVSDIIVKRRLNIKIVTIDRFGPLELSSSSKIKKKILNEWK